MKILCRVHGKPAMIVGYGPGRKGRPVAIIISEGKMRSALLKEIELGDIAQDLGKVVKIKEVS